MKTNKVRESHEPQLLAHNFLVEGVTPIDGWVPFDVTSGITNWNPDGNLNVGDCGFAMLDHANMAQLGDGSMAGQLFFPEFKGVLPAYWRYGLDNGEVGDPNPSKPDFGVENATMMAWLYKHGFIRGYLEVPLSQLDWWASQCDGACVGITLNEDTCFSEFQSMPKKPWGSNPADLTNNTAGHDVFYPKSIGDGTGQLVSWGSLMPFDPAFRANITDAWIIITRNMNFVDQEKLDVMLLKMHGVVTPYVEPTSALTASKGSWHEWVAELDRLKSWSNDRELAHKLAVNAIENESVNLLTGELGVLVSRFI